MLVILLLAACTSDKDAPSTSVTGPTGDTGTLSLPDLDLGERLPAGTARAGVVTDVSVLFGGISAEGRAGDVKIYNDRVQFVVQGVRDGSYYLTEGGGVVDADIIRPDGHSGHDLVDEWNAMYGLGRILDPDTVEVTSDGRDGQPAIVRVAGSEGGLGLLEGLLEVEGITPDLGLELVTEYVLAPDSWLLEVRSTLTATGGDVDVGVGDLMMGAPEVASLFSEGSGMGPESGVGRRWTGYISDRNDVAAAMVSPAGEAWTSRGFELLTSLADMAVHVAPVQTVPDGGSITVVRYFAVAPDLATISDAALALHGVNTETQSGTVTAPDGPVAGARVTVFVDGTPFTAATTADDGSFSAQVPAGSNATARATGRSTGRFTDLPPGAANYPAYGASPIQDASLDSLLVGAPDSATAEGRGVATSASPLELGEPAYLRILSDDDGPFTARLSFATGDPATGDGIDSTWVLDRASGLAAAGWSGKGELLITAEPGDYTLVVHRGIQHEVHTEALTLTPGAEVLVQAALPAAYESTGWILADPHTHASPSPDGDISMEERLVVQTASGIQVHFGTDHDHLADYRPIVGTLGYADQLVSVVSDEVSPPLRGHMNIYPVEPIPDAANGGAWRWWTEFPDSTEDLVDRLRARHGDAFILQSNHPLDSGVASSADWSPGVIGNADYWTDRFDAMEVLNAADTEEYLSVWWDIVLRGSFATPTGTSDSHSHFGGSPGLSATWMHTGGTITELTNADISDIFREGQVVVTRGPFLDLSEDPGVVPADTQIQVSAMGPSWVIVDRLQLWRDGAMIEEVAGTEATFTLATDIDAIFTIVAEGDTPMEPVNSRTPWAMTAPWRVDATGDGFEAPLPPLELQ